MDEAGRFPVVPRMQGFLIAQSVVSFLGLVVVALRVYSRVTTKAGFGWDDGLIVISLVLGVALVVIQGLLCIDGMGYPMELVGDNEPLLLKFITAHEALFIVSTLLTEFSILFFYLRIFSYHLYVKRATRVFMVFFCLWAVISIIQLMVQCQYDLNAPSMAAPTNTCHRGSVMENISALNIAGDLILFILPIPVIWRLQMETWTKIKLTVLFLLGIVVTVLAILKTVAIIRADFYSAQFTLYGQDILAYNVLEANARILCASLPMIQTTLGGWWKKFCTYLTNCAGHQPTGPGNRSSTTLGEPPMPLEGLPMGYRLEAEEKEDQKGGK
ncbi:hypothetical protein F5B20DRAFT_581763 [Whalleya microplaca]|nr:hypothetical protein F5B20DRAFT_581763 [Whalleya microplaca]